MQTKNGYDYWAAQKEANDREEERKRRRRQLAEQLAKTSGGVNQMYRMR